LSDRERSFGVEFEAPASVVDDVVVPGAQREQIDEIGRPAQFPRDDVVDLTPLEHDIAPGERTAAVDGSQRSSLAAVCATDGTTHVERVAVLIDDDRGDQPAQLAGPVRLAVIIGSTRDGCRGRDVADWYVDAIACDDRVTVDIVDLIAIELPDPDAFYAHDGVAELKARLDRAGVFVVVTPEYNHSLAASLVAAS
jgi:NADPH-dependent FMN reductase